jgi:hypothetical protein
LATESESKEPNSNLTNNETASVSDKIGEQKQRGTEYKLYKIVKAFLAADGYMVDDTSSARGNKKWGNPDVTGIQITESVSGNKELEIATVEVKTGLENWRTFIFEAVSHTRFANVSYYCFAYPEKDKDNLDDDLYLYAEEFSIGILGIEMEDEDYANFRDDQYDPEIGDVKITTIVTPRFRTLRPYFREEFLNSLGIFDQSSLMRFGSSIEEIKLEQEPHVSTESSISSEENRGNNQKHK